MESLDALFRLSSLSLPFSLEDAKNRSPIKSLSTQGTCERNLTWACPRAPRPSFGSSVSPASSSSALPSGLAGDASRLEPSSSLSSSFSVAEDCSSSDDSSFRRLVLSRLRTGGCTVSNDPRTKGYKPTLVSTWKEIAISVSSSRLLLWVSEHRHETIEHE